MKNSKPDIVRHCAVNEIEQHPDQRMLNEKEEKREAYRRLNRCAQKGQILFVGSSLCEQFPVNELSRSFNIRPMIYNRGIGGSVAGELLESMEECIFELEPSKIFINIGTNDIAQPDYEQSRLISKYETILDRIRKRLPETAVYVQAYYPVNPDEEFGLPEEVRKDMFCTRTNEAIVKANEALEELALKLGCTYINVNDGLMDEEGRLKKEYSREGLHMWPDAYAVVLNNLMQYLQ